MSWVREYPLFAAALVALSLAVLAEAGFLSERWAVARTARRRGDKMNRELRLLAAIQPEPTSANTARIEAELARTNQALAAAKAELIPPGPAAGRLGSATAPEHRPEAFFDIAAFVEAMSSRAEAAGVFLRPDERFGFSSYANEAPEAGRLAAVLRERRFEQYLLEALIDARPRQLLSVQRERPSGPGGRSTANPAGVGAADYFDLDPRLSARVPGIVETTAFRLVFTGGTAALRTFLNKLAGLEVPVVVRAVEVAPADGLRGVSASVRPGTTSLIAQPWSRFTVTVEFVVLASNPTPAS